MSDLHHSIDSTNFSIRGYPPSIQKDSVTNIHFLAIYVKEGLHFAWNLSLENSKDSYLCFRLAVLHLVSYFSPSFSLCMVFDAMSSNTREVLSINPSANVFILGGFNIYH